MRASWIILVAAVLVGFIATPAVAATTPVVWSSGTNPNNINVQGTSYVAPIFPALAQVPTYFAAIPNVQSILITSGATYFNATAGAVLPGGLPSTGRVEFTLEITQNNGGTWTPVWTTLVPSPPVVGGITMVALGTQMPVSWSNSLGAVSVNGLRLSANADYDAANGANGGWFGLAGATFTFDTEPNPEPATLILLSAGMGGLAWHRRRSRRARAE